MAFPERPRLLIFVIAYYAEATLQRVLERIPLSIYQDFDAEVLIVDDASKDGTFRAGNEFKANHPEKKVTVLRNGFNQGYGGNQKVGYAYAIAEKFDFVAMVHGDGQYAPEELPRLMEPLSHGEADAVFGSRMMTQFGALKGGMPLYKYVGNKVLTRTQNALLGTHLSEFHTGYRIYSVKMLERLQFELNSNDFHFDTEIIIQLLNAQARIVEKSIPTFYGDEISRVNGMKYAKDVMMATLRNTAHRAGLLYHRKFDPKSANPNELKTLKLGYPSSHTFALEAVPPGARVMEFSSSDAVLAPKLTEKNCETTVCAADALKGEALPDVSACDVILLLDVLEHLSSPEHFIEELRHQFGHAPKKVLISTPNIAFFVTRMMLLLGQFNQGKAGILDASHVRHFTYRSLRHLLTDHGLRILRVRGVPAPFPKVLGMGFLGRAALALNSGLIRISKTLFSYQIFIEAETTPDVWFVLKDSKAQSELQAGGAPRGAP